MRVFIASITELFQNFFNSEPLKFNEYFAITPSYQKYCLGANLPTRFTLTLAKEAMLIHDIAVNLLAGGVKLTTGSVKGICAIASGILGIETDHQTPSKQAVVHFGFACLYTADIFVSVTTINNTYPQHLMDKIKDIFTKFLEVPNRGTIIKYIIDPETEEALKKTQTEAKKQEELLKRTQRELKDIRDSDFISEEELEKISREAQQVLDTETHEEDPIKELTHKKDSSFLSNSKLAYAPSQFNLTYIEIDSDSDTDFSTQKEPSDFWFDDDKFSEDETTIEKNKKDGLCSNTTSLSEEQFLQEENRSIKNFPLKNQAALETKKVASQKKKKNTSPNNLLQTSAFARRKEYSKKVQTHRTKKALA